MKRWNKKLIFTATLVFVAVFLFFFQLTFSRSSSTLTVSFLDVGQGDAIFIEAPNGVQMLVDGGPDGSVLQELGRVMPFWDRSIDIVAATHPDADHIGGLPEVLKRFRVNYVLDTGVGSETGIYDEYTLQKSRSGADGVRAQVGQVIVLDSQAGVYAEILYPGKTIDESLDKNDTSIVMRIVYGEHEVMLTGDASTKVEKFLVSKYGNRLESDILKAGHHGSRTSTSEEFLEMVDPESVVVSAGLNNKFGHPHEEVIERVENFGAEIFETMGNGVVRFEFERSAPSP